MSAVPTLSIVIATYNRSQVLCHAIRSVLGSSFNDWELLVVGDACTDDTAECVAAFQDARITFVNLPTRVGDQSGPNNHGVALARGRFIAFLNHDDLYLTHHLSTCVALLESSDADLVWAGAAVALPAESTEPHDGARRFGMAGIPASRGYTPLAFYSASSWVMRRSLPDRVGPWRAPRIFSTVPSQEWLFRAWRRGAKLRFTRNIGVILVPAWFRRQVYQDRGSAEHESLAQWMRDDPKYLETLITNAAINEARDHVADNRYRPLRALARVALAPLYALQIAIGVHPHTLPSVLVHGLRGGPIRVHARRTGAR